MDEIEFRKIEFTSLREEIRDTKARLFKIAGIALVGLPAMSAASKALNMEDIILFLPGFIIASVLLYLSESSALMRCGTYIRQNYELECNGWETWLASREDDHVYRRRVDKLTFWFFMTVFCLYYCAASYMGVILAWSRGLLIGVGFLTAYSIIGGVFLNTLWRHYRPSTQTR